MKKIVLGAGLLLAASAAAAQLAPNAAGQPRDGIQTRAEVVDRTRAMFARVDANRDGFITAEEGRAVRGQVRQRVVRQRMVRGGNAAGGAMLFERLDANRDNVISRDEWARAQEMRAGQRGEALGGNVYLHRMDRRGRMGGAMLRQADANRDGRISLAEAEAAALQRFARVDLNRDGRVTREERQQLRQQRQLARPGVVPVR